MLKMPKEFGTADELLAHVPVTIQQHAFLGKMYENLRETKGLSSHDTQIAGMRVMVLNLAAQLEWALAAIDELQTEVAMLRGDGKR